MLSIIFINLIAISSGIIITTPSPDISDVIITNSNSTSYSSNIITVNDIVINGNKYLINVSFPNLKSITGYISIINRQHKYY
jgi:hypothetical protein